MLRYLSILFLAVIIQGRVILPELDESRIVGGQDADISEAPYTVALLHSSTGNYFAHTCGGSIISSRVVISAAHCAEKTQPQHWRVSAGSTYGFGSQFLEISNIISHPQYNKFTIDYDVALFITAQSILLDGITTKAIALPKQDQFVADDTLALITGWGSIREGGGISNVLQKATVPIVSYVDCQLAYIVINEITPRMICAGYPKGGVDSCQGDSGGPLAIDGELIGITSWGQGCARPFYPGVYARVPAFKTWIDENMNVK